MQVIHILSISLAFGLFKKIEPPPSSTACSVIFDKKLRLEIFVSHQIGRDDLYKLM